MIFRDLEEDEEGNLTEIPGTDKFYPADSVIISISQGPRNRIVSTTKGLEANPKGLLVADDTGHTTRPGIFASGDVVNGARTVVEAVAHSKVVAESMHRYMQEVVKREKEEAEKEQLKSTEDLSAAEEEEVVETAWEETKKASEENSSQQ